jgi:antitoxin component YwqK of YwqJK toxin-antitoxin module
MELKKEVKTILKPLAEGAVTATLQSSIKDLLIGGDSSKEAPLKKNKSRVTTDVDPKSKRRFPPAQEMFKMLFPTLDTRREMDPNAPKPKMVSPSTLDCFQSKVRKPEINFPPEAKEIIEEIRARRKARSCGASYSKTGSMDMKNLVCTPKTPPKDGVFQIRTPDGTPVLYVEYQNGKMHGVQKKFLNGALSEIAYYKEGKLHGEMRSYNNGVCVRKFTYKESALNGTMIQYGKGGEPIMKTNFLNNQQHGICVVYTQGYMVARTSFVKGKKQGMMRAFYPPHDPNEPQRISKEVFYLGDLMEGPSFTYYPSGQKYMEENFLKNLRNGPCIEYYDNGNIRKIAIYENNKLVKKPEEYDYYGKKMTI